MKTILLIGPQGLKLIERFLTINREKWRFHSLPENNQCTRQYHLQLIVINQINKCEWHCEQRHSKIYLINSQMIQKSV